MAAVAGSFKNHEGPKTAEELSAELDVPVRALREILADLEAMRLVVPSGHGEREPGYLPASPLADTSVADILLSIRRFRSGAAQSRAGAEASGNEPGPPLGAIFADLDRALVEIAGSHTLAELARKRDSQEVKTE